MGKTKKETVAKRHQTKTRYVHAIDGITKPVIKRLGHRGGVKMMRAIVREDTKQMMRGFVKKIVEDARLHTQNGKRKTTNVDDVRHALERNNVPVYYGGEEPKRKKKIAVKSE